MIRFALFLCLACPPVLAGPWMREPGSQFLSFTIEAAPDSDTLNPYTSVYYEVGLTSHLTLGIDAGSDILGFSSVILFARTPLRQGPNGSVFSAELGLGGATLGDTYQPAIRPGLSWGRPLMWFQGGWVSIDATYGYRFEDKRSLPKIEATIGVHQGERYKYLLQVMAEKPNGQSAEFSLTPGFAVKIGKEFHLVGGVTAYSKRDPSLKIAIWRDF